nr:MAG TPA: hypothetical protein [Caudoviricetes sp.]DAS11417.1 MAG TPA: hypothetical protein [Caudoviricetes sp.]
MLCISRAPANTLPKQLKPSTVYFLMPSPQYCGSCI